MGAEARYELALVTDANCTRTASGSAVVTVLPPAPAGLTATATGSATVQLSWSFSGSAVDRYRIERRAAGGEYVVINEVAATSYTDSTVAANAAYLYRVRAITESSEGVAVSDPSPSDLATAVAFTDDPFSAGRMVKATYITELRTAVNAVRALAGLFRRDLQRSQPERSACQGGTHSRVAHGARAGPVLAWPGVRIVYRSRACGWYLIRALHIAELRGGVR